MFSSDKCCINNFVFKQDQPSNFVYIVKSGEFQMTFREKTLKQMEIKIDTKIIGPFKKKQKPSLYSRNPQAIGRKFLEKEVKIATVSRGQIIGFNDVIFERPYSTSLRCISSVGTLLMISANDFK